MHNSLRTLVGISVLIVSSVIHAADPAQWQQFTRGDSVLLIRHALAPGGGDPAGFDLGDCATQRNLDETGRAQARGIGERLRRRGIASARVWSSQWCRCLETARLLDLGPVSELAGLNSFYELEETREPNLSSLRAFLARVPRNGKPIILVTHYVTIAALTGQAVSSGEGVFARLGNDGDLTFEARVGFD